MFHSARLKLTSWYLLLIMMVSVLFSLVIYSGINQEYNRMEHIQRLRLEQEEDGFIPSYEQFRKEQARQGFTIPPIPQALNPQIIVEARERLQLTLFIINLGILGIAGVAGYFLAGRTLKPIQEMLEEQNRFIADASHELRTPLTALRTGTEVGLRDKKISLREAKLLLTNNLEEIKNLQYLSNNLLNLAQFDSSNNSYTFKKIPLKPILEKVVIKFKPLLNSKKMQIAIKGENTEINGDEDQIQELFMILIENAIKYSPDKSKILISILQEKKSVVVKVKDEGIGINQKDITKIFDRFYRADTSRNKEGHGLGLSIAKKIIEVHKGSITVASKKNKGTTFLLTFNPN